MQEQETLILGVRSSRKKKRVAMIIAGFLVLAVIGGATYYIVSGKGNGFFEKAKVLSLRSWNEVLGMASQAPLISEVNIDPDESSTTDASFTEDLPQTEPSGSEYVFAHGSSTAAVIKKK